MYSKMSFCQMQSCPSKKKKSLAATHLCRNPLPSSSPSEWVRKTQIASISSAQTGGNGCPKKIANRQKIPFSDPTFAEFFAYFFKKKVMGGTLKSWRISDHLPRTWDGGREKHSFSFPFRSFGGGKISLPLLLLRFYLATAAAAAAAARMPDMSFSLAAHMEEEEGKPHKHSPCFSLKKKIPRLERLSLTKISIMSHPWLCN